MLYSDLHFYRKEEPKSSKDIGLWFSLLEFTSIISIAFNALLIYFGTDNIFNYYDYVLLNNKKFFPTQKFGFNDQGLFLIIIIEHCIVGLMFLLKELVPSCPQWIQKENETILKLIDEEVK